MYKKIQKQFIKISLKDSDYYRIITFYLRLAALLNKGWIKKNYKSRAIFLQVNLKLQLVWRYWKVREREINRDLRNKNILAMQESERGGGGDQYEDLRRWDEI